MRAYEDRNGALCIQAPPITAQPSGGVDVSCAPRGEVARALARDGVFASVHEQGTDVLFFGLVRGALGELVIEDALGRPSNAALGEEWPDALGHGTSVRPFIAVVSGPVPSVESPVTLYAGGEREGGWPPRQPE